MSIRDIVNREVVNITNCEHEPIHIPGSIQPHGFLLAVQKGSWEMAFCSGNVSQFTPYGPAQLLGKMLSVLMGSQQAGRFAQYIAGFVAGTTQPFVTDLEGTPYNTTIHFSGELVILELEPFPDGSLSLPNLYSQTQKFVSFLQNAQGVQQLSQKIAEETREITGYDRVMIYRFDEHYNGEVFAESKREDIPAFLGHHYPHTDIPAQARELYLRNLLRMIVDVHYEPVPIFTKDDGNAGKTLDLSHSVLRSVSPIHLQYLKNMSVDATLTISLVLEGRLWGMITCHHHSPKLLPHYTRLAAQLQAHFLTSQIRVQETAQDYQRTQEIEKDLNMLLKTLAAKEDFLLTCRTTRELSGFIGAGGTVIIKDKTVCSNGNVPDKKEVRKLHRWLLKNIGQDWWQTSRLSAHYPDAAAFIDRGAGLLYHSLGKGGDCIIWFRPEVVKAIEWAGNPSEAVVKDLSSGRLSPRTSFELWKEEVKGQSLPWHIAELQAATSFAYSLQKQIHLYYLRSFTKKLQTANAELENFNWIGAHDLNEPLRKIRIFASMLLNKPADEVPSDVLNSAVRIQAAANRMQTLIDDLLDYSAIRNEEKTFVEADLNLLLKEVLDELAETIAREQARISVAPLPVLKIIGPQVRELFIQLLTNALKFSRKDEPPQISITYKRVMRGGRHKNAAKRLYHRISVEDDGQGFDPVYRSKIFKVFQRLHPNAENKGTGIGLAISKKIMENHKGLIRARSQENAGATFFLYFPIDSGNTQEL